MSLPVDAQPAPVFSKAPRFQLRFAAIWLAFVALLALSAVVAPRSLLPSTFLSIIPLAAFLAIVAMGEAIVLMSRSIDLSIPAIISLSSTALLGFSGGRDDEIFAAVVVALLFAMVVGIVNGFLVAILRLNALIVTLAVGAITAGATLWYRESLPAESRVPPGLADWGGSRVLGLNVSVWVAAALAVLLTVVLRKTVVGRRFLAVGANPRAAWIAGIRVSVYQIAAFAVAGLLYGIAGILLSAFIRNPTLEVGTPYLLAPIAAAVLGGTAIAGGVGSMVAVAGAALFLTHLGQMLKMLGLSSALQFVIQGAAIALGMALAEFKLSRLKTLRAIGPIRTTVRINAKGMAVLSVITLAAVIWWSRATSDSWNDWLVRYQTLIAGILVLGGGGLAFTGLARQADLARGAERERRERDDIAARALLPATLDAIRTYAEACAHSLLGILPENTVQQKVSNRLDGGPAMPEGVLDALQAAIRSAGRDNAKELAGFLGALQIQQSRLRPLRDPAHALWRLEVLQRVIDAAELHAGATAMLGYARLSSEEVDLDLSNRQIAAALIDCRIVGNTDLNPMVASWTIAQSIYKADLRSA
jgi:ribose transport system permease protein